MQIRFKYKKPEPCATEQLSRNCFDARLPADFDRREGIVLGVQKRKLDQHQVATTVGDVADCLLRGLNNGSVEDLSRSE
jgi:hypothetical protein